MATRGWENATPNDVRDRRVPKKPAKYGAIPTTVDGIRFHSTKEAKRYRELKLLEKAGKITGLQLQPVFSLWAYSGVDRAPQTVGSYRADFAYFDANGLYVVEDVKGMRTLPLAKWKQKHVFAQYGIQIREVR